MTVILVAHILVSIVLVVVVLMQRSEGGALGIGGGGGGGAGGGLMSGRGVAGALVRTTIIFGAIFFVTSLGLTTLATKNNGDGTTEIERNLQEEFGTDPADDGLGIEGLDDVLGQSTEIELSDDPLAVTPNVSAPQAVEEEEVSTDPLADPLADPQE